MALMTSMFVYLLALGALAVSSRAQIAYEFVPDWLTPPPGKQTIGNSHGEIQVDSADNVDVSVQDKDAGIQVYGPLRPVGVR
jgi:hypothetical protein